MKARQFWYPLPERLIAQHPAERRGTERMMVLHRETGVIEQPFFSTVNSMEVAGSVCSAIKTAA